jgi:hypothetical protein
MRRPDTDSAAHSPHPHEPGGVYRRDGDEPDRVVADAERRAMALLILCRRPDVPSPGDRTGSGADGP